MARKYSSEAHLRKLIRKIVREELANSHRESSYYHPPIPHEIERDHYPESGDFPPAPSKAPSINQEFLDEWADSPPWAIFGSPEPDFQKKARIQQNRPKSLPSWSEPYRPSVKNFPSSPFNPNKARKK